MLGVKYPVKNLKIPGDKDTNAVRLDFNAANGTALATGTPQTYYWREWALDTAKFYPFGLFVDNSAGTTPLQITLNPIGIVLNFAVGERAMRPFPGQDGDGSFTITGNGNVVVHFVDYPVEPWSDLVPGAGGTGVSANQVQGNTAGTTADIGNPVKVGAVYNTALPTYTNGQRTDLQAGLRGGLLVTASGQSAASSDAFNNNVLYGTDQGQANRIPVVGNYVFNGTTWDRMRGDTNGTQVQDANRTVEITTNFTRPADTVAYAVGDLIANNTTAGSVVAMTFATVNRSTGKGLQVRRARIARSKTADITGYQIRLHLFSAAPTVTNGDNGAFLPSGALTYLGALETVSVMQASDGATIVLTPLAGMEINTRPAATSLFGLLEARGAMTPASAEVFTTTLEIGQD